MEGVYRILSNAVVLSMLTPILKINLYCREWEVLGLESTVPPEHILESLDQEVELILESLDSKHLGIR